MKKYLYSLFVFLACVQIFSSVPSFWQTTVDPLTLPQLTALVTDYSNVLDWLTLSWLNNDAFIIEQATSAQIASVLFPNRNGNELFDIGMRLFRESGIGQADKNNWLLLLIATEEKKLRIIVGYWLEWVFPDIRVRDLIESQLRPAINEEQRATAITLYHQAIQSRLLEDWWSETWVQAENYTPTIRDVLFFFIWSFITFLSFRLLREKKTSLTTQIWPLFPFIGLFLLILLSLPGILGAFFWYFLWIIFGLLAYPGVWGNKGNFTPRWWGNSFWWGFGGGGFWWFWGWSSGGGGAGD